MSASSVMNSPIGLAVPSSEQSEAKKGVVVSATPAHVVNKDFSLMATSRVRKERVVKPSELKKIQEKKDQILRERRQTLAKLRELEVKEGQRRQQYIDAVNIERNRARQLVRDAQELQKNLDVLDSAAVVSTPGSPGQQHRQQMIDDVNRARVKDAKDAEQAANGIKAIGSDAADDDDDMFAFVQPPTPIIAASPPTGDKKHIDTSAGSSVSSVIEVLPKKKKVVTSSPVSLTAALPKKKKAKKHTKVVKVEKVPAVATVAELVQEAQFFDLTKMPSNVSSGISRSRVISVPATTATVPVTVNVATVVSVNAPSADPNNTETRYIDEFGRIKNIKS